MKIKVIDGFLCTRKLDKCINRVYRCFECVINLWLVRCWFDCVATNYYVYCIPYELNVARIKSENSISFFGNTDIFGLCGVTISSVVLVFFCHVCWIILLMVIYGWNIFSFRSYFMRINIHIEINVNKCRFIVVDLIFTQFSLVYTI